MTLSLLPYQYEGATFLAGRRRAGLFDDMGLGKTAQAIVAMDAIRARRVIIVCPASAKAVWAGELKKFSIAAHRIVHDLHSWLDGRPGILICSYEMATKWSFKLQGDLVDLIIFDESQYLKTKGTGRTTRMLGFECDGGHGLAQWAARVWFLSGTPATNDPADIWPFLKFVGGTELTRQSFINRYFKSKLRSYSEEHRIRREMLPELRQAIFSSCLRRTADEVDLQLPPVWLTTETVDGDTAEICALLRAHPDLEEAIVEAVEQGGLSFLQAPHVATLRRLVGEAKAPAAVELISEELDNGMDKVVVFFAHRRALEVAWHGFADRGYNPVRIEGQIGEGARIDAVEHFQRDPACRVFLGNIKAAGTAITLTAACNIVMLESAWTPTDNAQALKRVHRIGQNRTVRARFITLANSIDEVVNASVARKTAELSKLGLLQDIAA